MSRVCELTGKAKFKGNRVSHSNIKTRRFLLPNLVARKWRLHELGKSITVKLSTSALKVIDARGGLERAIMQESDCNLSERLLKVKRDIIKKRKTKSTSGKTQPEPQDKVHA